MKVVNWRRRAAAVACICLVIGGLTACGGSGSGASPATKSSGPVTLQYWDMEWGGPAFMNAIKKNVAEFNATHPDIHVKFTQLSWGDYMQKIISAVQAGTPPDISGGDSGIPFTMNAQGQALDISDLYAKWQKEGLLDKMVPWAYQKWNYEGHRIGATWQFDPRAIYYRKDLLAKAGIKPPTTWSELLAAAQKLNGNGVTGIAFPGKQGAYDTDQFFMTLVFQAGGGLANPQGQPTFDGPAELKALEFEKQLMDCCASPATPAWSFTEVLKAYNSGKAAFAFGGGWFIGAIKSNKSNPSLFKNTGILPVLEGPGGPSARHSVAFANPWMIYKGTKHPAQAKVFLDWMMQPEHLRALYASDPGGKWPVYKSMLNDKIFKANPLIATLAKQTVHNGIDYWYPNNKGGVGIGAIGTTIADTIVNPVITGKRSPQDALAEAQRKVEPLFKHK